MNDLFCETAPASDNSDFLFDGTPENTNKFGRQFLTAASPPDFESRRNPSLTTAAAIPSRISPHRAFIALLFISQ
jgi:hypothetical protein